MADVSPRNDPSGLRSPTWFRIVAVVAVLFEIVGFAGYLMDALRSPDQIAQLPLDQRLVWNATPTWIYAAYAVATSTGLIGAIAMVMRRRWCIALLGLSLLAVIVQFGGVYAVPRLRRIVAPDAMIAPLVIFIVCAGIYAVALHAHRRGWLTS